MLFDPADLPAVTGTLRLRDDDKSSLKVFAKLMRVGGMSVSPSLSTAFWYSASTTMEFTFFSEKLPFELDSSNGTVGIPNHRAAIQVSRGILI